MVVHPIFGRRQKIHLLNSDTKKFANFRHLLIASIYWLQHWAVAKASLREDYC
jgi:hypothetical protein